MFYRRAIKIFASSRISYLRQYKDASNIFGNYRSISPLSTTKLALKDEKVKVVFNLYDGRRIEAEGKVGDTLLDVVVNNDLDIEGYGACEGTVTCSTCHVSLSQKDYDRVKVVFNLYDGRRIEAEGKVGDTLLDVVVNNDLDIEGYGACEGTVTCSTCHVSLSQKDYDSLPEKAGDEERDMLDLAYGLTDTSRLGCQVTLTKELDGLEVKVPESVNDARS